jgi:glycosyltransferase involved in cell wall biosynthesis
LKNTSILYLTYDGLTDPLGQSQVLPYLQGLSRKGWEITVISFEKPERFKTWQTTVHEQCKRNNIHWIPKVYHKNPPVFSTLGDIKTLSKSVQKVVKEEKPMLIHCRSYLPMLVALPYQKQGIKVIFDMRGFWADERVEGGIWNMGNPILKRVYRFFKKKETMFYKNADAIVSLTKAAVPIINKINANASISVIPTATDLVLFNPEKINQAEKEKLKTNLGLKNQLVLGYIGSLGTWYLTDEMMAFYSRLLKQYPEAVFLIISHDSISFLFEISKKYGINKNKIIVKKADRNEMPLYLSIMDFSVMFIKPAFSKKASSPTKLGELMAMGIPVVCNADVGDVEEIVEKYHAGIVLNDLTDYSFDSTIDKILKNNEWFDAALMRNGAVEYYDLEKGVIKYDQIYKNI